MLIHVSPGLEVRWYGPVWHTSTSLATWKAYRHFFPRKDILVCSAGSFPTFS